MKSVAILFLFFGLSLTGCDSNTSNQEEPGQQNINDPDFGSGGRGVDTTANDVDTTQFDVGPEYEEDTVN